MTDPRAMVPAAGGAPPALTSSDMLRGLHTVRSVLAPELSDDELKLFAMVATRSGLDPFAKQVYAVKRKGRVTFQTGIDGYRSIAARTGLYDGQDEPEYGPICQCGDSRPAGHPECATVRVYRKGVGRPIAATAYWHEYVPAAGTSGEGDVMWRRMPRVMIAKVAEALALRKAFPYDPERREGIGADLYTADEMAQAGRSEAPAAPQPTARERVAARAAAVSQPAAEPEELFDEPQEDASRRPSPPALAEPAADEIVGEFTATPVGLSAAALASLARQAGRTKGQLALAISALGQPVPAPTEVTAVVTAMTDEERGRLATELNLDWRAS